MSRQNSQNCFTSVNDSLSGPDCLLEKVFLKVVFPWGGEGQFDPPPLYFKRNLSNFKKTLYNCQTIYLRYVESKKTPTSSVMS